MKSKKRITRKRIHKKRTYKKRINKKHIMKNQLGGKIECANNMEVYMMKGHGGVGIDRKEVPSGCVYVSTTMCGNVSTTNGMKGTFLRIFESNNDILREPWKTESFKILDKSITNTKSSIYNNSSHDNNNSEGYKRFDFSYLTMHLPRDCIYESEPNEEIFNYLDSELEPCSYWFYNNPDGYDSSKPTEYNSVLFERSGLLRMGDITSYDLHDESQRNNPNRFNGLWHITLFKHDNYNFPMVSEKNIIDMYADSIYPTIDEVLERKNEYISGHSQLAYCIDESQHDETLISAHEFVEIILELTITQSELFRLYPGIHYFTICRPFNTKDHSSRLTQRRYSITNKPKLLSMIAEHSTPELSIDQSSRFKQNEQIIYKLKQCKVISAKPFKSTYKYELLTDCESIQLALEDQIFKYPKFMINQEVLFQSKIYKVIHLQPVDQPNKTYLYKLINKVDETDEVDNVLEIDIEYASEIPDYRDRPRPITCIMHISRIRDICSWIPNPKTNELGVFPPLSYFKSASEETNFDILIGLEKAGLYNDLPDTRGAAKYENAFIDAIKKIRLRKYDKKSLIQMYTWLLTIYGII